MQKRKARADKGIVVATQRDLYALTWIGEQYAIRLDQLQYLLAEQPGHGAKNEEKISEGATRDVLTRWQKAGWVESRRFLSGEPRWIWLSGQAVRQLGLPYRRHALSPAHFPRLAHLYAINEIRLTVTHKRWVSERELMSEAASGKVRLHRPDAEMMLCEGDLVAIEAELTKKKTSQLQANLLHLLRGERYVQVLAEGGKEAALLQSRGYRSRYHEIWFFAPPLVRKFICTVRLDLLKEGKISPEEALRIEVYWYPVAKGKDEEQLEEQEKEQEVRRMKAMRT